MWQRELLTFFFFHLYRLFGNILRKLWYLYQALWGAMTRDLKWDEEKTNEEEVQHSWNNLESGKE